MGDGFYPSTLGIFKTKLYGQTQLVLIPSPESSHLPHFVDVGFLYASRGILVGYSVNDLFSGDDPVLFFLNSVTWVALSGSGDLVFELRSDLRPLFYSVSDLSKSFDIRYVGESCANGAGALYRPASPRTLCPTAVDLAWCGLRLGWNSQDEL
jgi:hypothetical protein